MNKQQPYDSSIKGMLQEDAADIVPQFLPGAIFIDTLDIEVLRPALRTDRVYQISYRERPHLLHLEFQSSSDSKMPHRLLAYHAGLWLERQLSIVSMVVYLFPTSTPRPPLRELSGKQEILIFQYPTRCATRLKESLSIPYDTREDTLQMLATNELQEGYRGVAASTRS